MYDICSLDIFLASHTHTYALITSQRAHLARRTNRFLLKVHLHCSARSPFEGSSPRLASRRAVSIPQSLEAISGRGNRDIEIALRIPARCSLEHLYIPSPVHTLHICTHTHIHMLAGGDSVRESVSDTEKIRARAQPSSFATCNQCCMLGYDRPASEHTFARFRMKWPNPDGHRPNIAPAAVG